MSVNDLTAYEVIQKADLSDLQSEGILLKHRKSGARILLMKNDDENKVFAIGFGHRLRTAQGFRISWSIRYCAAREIFR